MQLSKLMKPKNNFPVMAASDTVDHAIREMIAQESGVVLVGDENMKLMGIFSERDVMLKLVSKGLDANKTCLDEVMTTDIIKVEDTVDARDAVQTMVDGRIRHLPVVTDENKIVGVLSLRYLLHDRIKELLEECNSLEAYLNDAQGG